MGKGMKDQKARDAISFVVCELFSISFFVAIVVSSSQRLSTLGGTVNGRMKEPRATGLALRLFQIALPDTATRSSCAFVSLHSAARRCVGPPLCSDDAVATPDARREEVQAESKGGWRERFPGICDAIEMRIE